MKNSCALVGIVCLFGSSQPVAAQHPAAGPEFQVNTYTTFDQLRPSVAMDVDGAFVVVWQSWVSSGSDSDSTSIQAQRYSSDGSALGSEVQVNTYTTNLQLGPSVAMNADGDFVVVWSSNGSSGSDTDWSSIQAQRCASDGSVLGSQFQVNTYTTGEQNFPTVGMAADGDFVVVWSSEGSSGSDACCYSIQAQRYASDGSALGSQFQVNTYTTNWQLDPSVGTDADGDFVVVWFSEGSSGSDTDWHSIQAQRYASDGSALGSQFQVNTCTTYYQYEPSVGVAADGEFVVVWESSCSTGTDTDSGSIEAQRYSSEGSALGSEFQANTYTTWHQSDPSVAMDVDGDVVVVWRSDGSSGTDTDSYSIQAQRYSSDGSALGSQFQVNTYTTSSQHEPLVGVDADGDFVVVWQSNGSSGSDTSGYSIQAQRYFAPVFADGFESGNTSAWSRSVP